MTAPFVLQKEIEDMIWEVDENLDTCVDWEEFQLMFQRNIKDTTGEAQVKNRTCLDASQHACDPFSAGKEPFQLFNVVQFMMYDVDFSGEVSVDETMHMLYARYGKARLEKEMKALFGDKLHNGNGTLTFLDYLKAVSIRVPRDPRLARKGVGVPV